MHPDFSKPCIIRLCSCCRRTTRTCWASRERVGSLCQDPSNFVAGSAPIPPKPRRSDPPLPPAQAVPALGAAGAAAAGPPPARRPQRWRSRPSRSVGAKTPEISSQRSLKLRRGLRARGRRQCPTPPRRPRLGRAKEMQRRRKQINPVVLDDRCAVVFRKRTAIQLPA